MNRVMRGSVLLAAAAVGVWGCSSDPTDSLRNGVVGLLATPTVVFVQQGDSAAVIVEAVDAQDNRLATDFTISTPPGAGVLVNEDTLFNLEYDANGNLIQPPHPTRVRYNVKAVSLVATSFTVSGGGKSITIGVNGAPNPLNLPFATIDSTAPALGSIVTLTAPAGFRFTPTSVVTVGGGAVAFVALAADSSSIQFIPGPSANGPVSVTNAVVSFTPTTGFFTLTTGATILTTSAVTSLPAVFSSSTPNVNDTVTMTAAGFKFLPGATVTIGGRPSTIVSIAVDSLSLQFIPTPGTASGPATVTNVALSFLTGIPLTLPTAASLTVPAGRSGTGSIATAPTLTLPATGVTEIFVDAGPFTGANCTAALGGPCREYKMVVAASTTIQVTATWQALADLGVYFLDATGTTDVFGDFACDAHGNGATGQPESCTETLAPGTYFLAVVTFSASYPPPNNVDPTDFKLVIVGQ